MKNESFSVCNTTLFALYCFAGRNNLGPAEVPFFILRQKSQFLSFFGAFYDCYEIAVLWFEQKNFLYFHNEKTEIFSQFGTKPTMFKLLKLNCGTERLLYQMSLPRPFFFALCNPVLYGWIFLYLGFTQSFTGIYSKSSLRQRTNRER